ncbi:hypothetical protein CLI64_13620 [Nostoc sp. CENA543]|uniref:hypothetical protein n=1 Tax=Nostoc sp. CENA543 TaxID=1869241 RepID=UPI000CA1E617|nr:hypothetical protein [Nostoc sp. CENA543]AUT01355.1 hypothetical protein CLI64_13620 [Nostoc sp. CENA543]
MKTEKLEIRIDPNTKQWLTQLSVETGQPVSAVVRDALSFLQMDRGTRAAYLMILESLVGLSPTDTLNTLGAIIETIKEIKTNGTDKALCSQ